MNFLLAFLQGVQKAQLIKMAGLVSDPEMLQFSISLIFLFFNVFESEGQEKEAIISTQQLLETSWMERQKTVLEIQIPICWQLRLAE